jgi:hypothetical protein
MAKTTFGAELKRMMDERNVSIRELTRRLYGSADNRTQVMRWLAIDTAEQAKGNAIEAASLQRVVEALELPYVDQVFLYGLAGLLPAMVIPGEAEIKERLSEYIPRMEAHPFPAYVLDAIHYRFWLANAEAVTLAGGMERAKHLASRSVFQILFDPALGIIQRVDDAALLQIRRNNIGFFKALNILRRHEPFFMAYPERLRDVDGLNSDAYAEFHRLWDTTPPGDESLPNEDLVIAVGGHGSVVFTIKPEPIVALGDLFHVAWYDVYEAQSRAPVETLFASNGGSGCIRLWEFDGVDLAGSFGMRQSMN